MPSILVNCHGGRVAGPPPSPNPPTFLVPAGVTINFYIADGVILQNEDAWDILQRKLQHVAIPAAFVVSQGPGTQCFDYWGVPYNSVALEVANGIMVERANGRFERVLDGGSGQQWGLLEAQTQLANPADSLTVFRPQLPAVGGGGAYARPAIQLSNIAAYAAAAGFTEVDWIACREYW